MIVREYSEWGQKDRPAYWQKIDSPDEALKLPWLRARGAIEVWDLIDKDYLWVISKFNVLVAIIFME